MEGLAGEGKGTPGLCAGEDQMHQGLGPNGGPTAPSSGIQEEHACPPVERGSVQEPRVPPKGQNLGQELLHIKWPAHLVNPPTSSAWREKETGLRESRWP